MRCSPCCDRGIASSTSLSIARRSGVEGYRHRHRSTSRQHALRPGILAGVLLSIALYLWRTSRPHIAIVGQEPGTEHYRNIERHRVITSPNILSVRVDESLSFADARYLEDRLYDEVAKRPDVRHVVLVCPAVNYIDASALDSLEGVNDRLKQAGVTFHLSEVKGPVLDRLQRSKFLDHLTGRVFLSQHQAMTALDPETTASADAAAPPSIAVSGRTS